VTRERYREIERERKRAWEKETYSKDPPNFFFSFVGLTRERERERKFERDWERNWEGFGRELRERRCVIEGMDWVPFIVKWMAKIAPKRSHLTAGEKI